MARSTTNSNVRGSAKQRRARKQWLLERYGDGKYATCQMERHSKCCPGRIDFATMTVDRHPIPGCEGGRYVRDNIRPAWGPCNYRDGGHKGAKRAKAG